MRVDSGGIGIEVEVTGTGRPVVLLHGFPDTGALWRKQVPALVDAGFSVIVPTSAATASPTSPKGSISIRFLTSSVMSSPSSMRSR